MDKKSQRKEWTLEDIERIVSETPALQDFIDKLWIKAPDIDVPEYVIRKLNEKAMKACREDDSHTKNLSS